jgi:hypothetical protein
MRFAQTAALAERGVIEIFRLDARAGGDVVADEVEPGLAYAEARALRWAGVASRRATGSILSRP